MAVVFSAIALALAACAAVFNWACVIASYRFRRQGVQRHVSTVPIVAQALVVIAAVISARAASPLAPTWLFWLVAFLDPALFSILYLPVFLLRRRFHAQA